MAFAMTANDMSIRTFLAAGTFLVSLTGIFVAVRIWSNTKYTKRLLIGDYIATLATILVAANFAINYETVVALTRPTTTLEYLAKLSTAIGIVASLSMWSAKAPILLLYIRLFHIKKWLRITSYCILGSTFIILMTTSTVSVISCAPGIHKITPQFLAKCATKSSRFGIANGVVAVVTDVMIFVLPMPIIIRMQLPLHKRIGLAAVFFTGVFAIVASVISLHYKVLSLSGTSMDMKAAMLCTIIESCIAIIVCCAPSLYSFSTNFAKSPFYSRIRSIFSQVSITSRPSYWKSSGKGSIPNSEHSKDSTKVKSHYVTLGDEHSTKGLVDPTPHLPSNTFHTAPVYLNDLDARV